MNNIGERPICTLDDQWNSSSNYEAEIRSRVAGESVPKYEPRESGYYKG